MPLRRFAAYFIGISVCSTIAFASADASRPAPQETAVPAPCPMPAPVALTAHVVHKALLVATAE